MIPGMDDKASADDSLPVSKGGAGRMSPEQVAAGERALDEIALEERAGVEPGGLQAGGIVNSPEPYLVTPGETSRPVVAGSPGSREYLAARTAGRHPGTIGLVRYFAYAHLPEHLQRVSAPFGYLAELLVGLLPDSPELTTALRKLVEAKDCAVRAMVDTLDA